LSLDRRVAYPGLALTISLRNVDLAPGPLFAKEELSPVRHLMPTAFVFPFL